MRRGVARVQLDRPPVRPLRCREVPLVHQEVSGPSGVRLGQRRVQFQRPLHRPSHALSALLRRDVAVHAEGPVRVGQTGARRSVLRVGPDGAVEVIDSLGETTAVPLVEEVPPFQVERVGLEIFGRLPSQAFALRGGELRVHRARDPQREVRLDLEDVGQATFICFRPEMEAGRDVDELRGDTDPVTLLAHAPFQHGARAQRATDLADVPVHALEGEGGGTRHDAQRLHARQGRDQLFGQAVAEILVVRVATEVGEGQHRD